MPGFQPLREGAGYAMAMSLGESLLDRGDDFRHTDVRSHEA